MNELEKLLLEQIKKDSCKDPATQAKTPSKMHSLTKRAFHLGSAIGIGCAAFYACNSTLETDYSPIAIAICIWGACGISYSIRKVIA